MVKIMRQVWGNMLVDSPLRNDEMNDKLTLPCPADLKHRILVKVKYTPPEKAKKSKLQSTGSTTSVRSSSVSSASSDDDNEPARSGKPKKRKMIEDLTQLGVYARSYHFKSFNQPGMYDLSASIIFMNLPLKRWIGALITKYRGKVSHARFLSLRK